MKGRPVLFDTNVYVAAIQGGFASFAFRLIEENLPNTHFASVIAGELRTGRDPC